MGYFRKLMKEPSTYAGAALVSMAAGQLAGPEALALAGASPWAALIMALVAVLKAEPGHKD